MFGGWFGGFSGAVPNFAFSLEEPFAEVESLSGVKWTLRGGTTQETKTPVTVFTIPVGDTSGSSPTSEQCGRNALKRAKTLRLPFFLKVLDATEHKGVVYIATERCVPLGTALAHRADYYEADDDKFIEGVALGLYHVAKALESLHRNNLSHHNVNSDSVFVLPSGEWRLFGVDLVSPFDEEHSLYRRCRTCIAEHRVPNSGRHGVDTVSSVDAWGLGCLIYEVFLPPGRAVRSIAPSDLRLPPPSTTPKKVLSTLSALFAAEPKMRWTMTRFLAECPLLTESDYVADLHELNELGIRDAAERDAFLRRLSARVDRYPLPACKFLVLEKLGSAVKFGGCSATVLEPLLRIGARLSPEEFAEHVSPSVVALFQSPDQHVRHRLLSTAEDYAPLLPQALVCDVIWPQYALGFTHKAAEIRELSVRSLIHFAPKLSEKLVASDAVKAVSALQQDREGPIRTNSTICLGLIAKYLPPAERSRILLTSFARMLKDPFAPSRLAAVKSFSTCAEHFSEEHMAKTIVPAVVPLMVDTEGDVRRAASKCVRTMLAKIDAFVNAIAADPTPQTESSTTPVAPTPATPGPENSSRGWFGGWGRKPEHTASVAAPEPRSSSVEQLTPTRSRSATFDDPPSGAVPAAPTAARAAQSLSEDPMRSTTSPGGGEPLSKTPSSAWLDEVGASNKSSSPASRGMSLRKKAISAKKSD